jgi:hypothetical protein
MTSKHIDAYAQISSFLTEPMKTVGASSNQMIMTGINVAFSDNMGSAVSAVTVFFTQEIAASITVDEPLTAQWLTAMTKTQVSFNAWLSDGSLVSKTYTPPDVTVIIDVTGTLEEIVSNVILEIATQIPFTAKLTDKTSAEYLAQSDNLKANLGSALSSGVASATGKG